MHDQLRRVLRQRRVAAQISQRAIAPTTGVSHANLSRLESGDANWGQNIERVVAAYAEAFGITPVEIWREALELYEREWVAPTKRRLKARVRAQEEL